MERELTSISEACEKNCFFSYGTDFTVYCDKEDIKDATKKTSVYSNLNDIIVHQTWHTNLRPNYRATGRLRTV